MLYDMNREPGHAELAEQVTHPLDLYQPGSERLEKLYASIEHAQRFQQPDVLAFNM